MHDEAWDVWFPGALEVTAAGVRDFGRAVRCWHVPHDSPLILPDPETATPATIGASALLGAAAIVVSRTISGRNMARVLHVGQGFSYRRHPAIGDVLDVGASLTARTTRGSVEILTIGAGLAAGGVVWVRSTSTTAYDSSSGSPTARGGYEDSAEDVMLTGSGPRSVRSTN